MGPVTSILTFVFFSKMHQTISFLFMKFFFGKNFYFIYKCKKKFDPTPRRTSRTSPRWNATKIFESYKIFYKIQNDMKNQYTLAHSWKSASKLKMKSHDQKNVVLVNLSKHAQKLCFFGSCDFNFNLKFSQKCAIDPYSHYVFLWIHILIFHSL